MTVENAGEGRSDTAAPAVSDGDSDGIRNHPVLFGLVSAGYLAALLGGLVAAWAAPRALGRHLDWTRQASGLFAADGIVVGSAFRVAFASFPIVFAACVVAIDVATIRSLTDGSTPNRRGLAGWSLIAVAGLAALMGPVNPILPPYGLVRLLSAPALGVAGLVAVTVAGGVAGVAGLSIPVRLTRSRVSLASATRRAIAEVRTAPIEATVPVRSVILGWGIGSGLLLIGSGLLALALGIFVVGLLLLPAVLVVWTLAAVAFAGGHLRYRLQTVSNTACD